MAGPEISTRSLGDIVSPLLIPAQLDPDPGWRVTEGLKDITSVTLSDLIKHGEQVLRNVHHSVMLNDNACAFVQCLTKDEGARPDFAEDLHLNMT